MRPWFVAAALLVTATAHAWTRTSTNVEIAPAVIHAKLEGSIATLTARFVIPVEKQMYGSSYAGIELPRMGLVTSAMITSRGITVPLSMLAADEADTKFAALADDSDQTMPTASMASAVLISGGAGGVRVSLASPHSGVVTIELTIAAPTCFYRDARYLQVPETWLKVAELSLRRPTPKTEELDAECGSLPPDGHDGDVAWIGFPAPELAKRRPGERIGAFAGRIALGEEHLARVEIDLAGVLSEVPRDLVTVILVDGSRSMSADDLEAQRQLVASYLRKAPDSRVQVVAYARRARALLPGWTTASQAAGRVDRELRSLAQRNGSNFDAGLAEAATWLDRIEGTKRVILITDERMAERLSETSPVNLRRLLPGQTLVHVVALGGIGQPARDEDALLAPLAASTDGIAVRVGAIKAPGLVDATLLVRPISLDHITIKAPGWTAIAPSQQPACGDELDKLLPEGSSCTWWGEGDVSAGPIVVEGLLWGKRTLRMLRPDASRARDLARELSAFGTLEEPMLERINTIARAVNSKWSLYAQWGGGGLYTAGFGFGLGGGSSDGCCCCTRDIGRGTGTRAVWDPPDLAGQLRPLLAACHVETASIQATLEMTLVEIVNVTVSINRSHEVSPSIARQQQQCVEDALWDATPMLTHIVAHYSYSVAMPAIH